MTILKKKAKVTNSTDNTTFNIYLGKESIKFNTTKTFNFMQDTQLLSIITKGIIEPCVPNESGYINYQVSLKDNDDKNKLVGFINFFANGLNKDSSEDEINDSIVNLKDVLSNVQLDDITMPMTESEATALLDNL